MITRTIYKPKIIKVNGKDQWIRAMKSSIEVTTQIPKYPNTQISIAAIVVMNNIL